MGDNVDGSSVGSSVGASVGGTTGAMGAGVGGAGVDGTGTGNVFAFFFADNLRGRRLGTDAAASGVASMLTEAAAAACSETKENKASELFRKDETKRHRTIIRRTQQPISTFLFVVGLCLVREYSILPLTGSVVWFL